MDKKGHNPISGKAIAQYKLLESLKKTPFFALRLGKTIWRNNQWILSSSKLKELLKKDISVDDLVDADVRPLIEQKTVDMKIGIDIAMIATKRIADLLIIITGDADMVPALKLARQEGMQVGLDPLRSNIDSHLSEHVDFICSFI